MKHHQRLQVLTALFPGTRHSSYLATPTLGVAIFLALLAPVQAQPQAVEWHGMLDVHAVAADSAPSWTRAGLGKSRYDPDSGGLRLGQAFLQARGDVSESISGNVVLSLADDRATALDINEAWLLWSPVPTSDWKTRLKVGAFFPASSLEIDYESLGWTPRRTVSSAAINSWLGEELRTLGAEVTLTHKGRSSGSPHSYGVSAAVFGGNDPAGSLLAWRGWSVSDRITGLTEPLLLADLPAYRQGDPSAPLPVQDRSLRAFKEIDGRPGFYVGAHYAYAQTLEVAAMHYDNRADPLVVKGGQYSWNTRFDHVSVRLRPAGQWELAAQALRGETIMGPDAVRLTFQAGYLSATHPWAGGDLTLRLDHFRTDENDILPGDPNGEVGRSLAMAYAVPLKSVVPPTGQFTLVTELLLLESDRPARSQIGQAARQTEQSWTTSLRWQF